MSAVVVPAVARRAAAVVLVLAALVHGVRCGTDHTELEESAHGGNAPPSWRPGVNATDGPSPPPVEGCDCPPRPPPWEFLNEKLEALYPVIQAFKRTVTCDPHGVTATWVGTKICDSHTGGGAYKGFYCDYPPDANTTLTVASIDFNGFGLCAPSLAGFLDSFPDLALFHANSNNLTGDVPDLTSLRYFYELDLSNNNFSGGFPPTVTPLSNLSFLDLRFNAFAGSVPPAVFSALPAVEALFLNNNGFSGPIPDSLGGTAATYLVVANNQFTGPIPKSIYNTSANLTEALFLNNRLSGCLPYEVGLVEGLQVFDAGGNEITGPIPLSFGCLGEVEELNLAGNALYGRVPDVVCLLARHGRLGNLSLSGNYFHSVGYHCLELVRSRVLDVRGNCILGFPHQRSPIECALFYADPTRQHCPFVPHIPCDLPGFRPPVTATLPDNTARRGRGPKGGGNW